MEFINSEPIVCQIIGINIVGEIFDKFVNLTVSWKLTWKIAPDLKFHSNLNFQYLIPVSIFLSFFLKKSALVMIEQL